MLVLPATGTFRADPQHPGGVDAPQNSPPPLPSSLGQSSSSPAGSQGAGAGFGPQLEPFVVSPPGQHCGHPCPSLSQTSTDNSPALMRGWGRAPRAQELAAGFELGTRILEEEGEVTSWDRITPVPPSETHQA